MNIYVGNLPYQVTDQDLVDAFKEFGTVKSARLVMDKQSGRSKGFGFVEMPEQSQGEMAIKQLDGKDLKGRTIKVNEALPKTDRPTNNR